MACSGCGQKKAVVSSSNYYQQNFSSNKKETTTSSPAKKKECEVTYKKLCGLMSDINASGITKEEKDPLRLQVAMWVQDIYRKCPDPEKYNEINNKIHGTDSSQDK